MTRQQQFETALREEYNTLQGTVETNQQAVQALQEQVNQGFEASNQSLGRLEESIAALTTMMQKMVKAQGKQPEEPPSSGVTAPQQTQQSPHVDLTATGDGLLGGNPTEASTHNQSSLGAGSSHPQEPRLALEPTVRTSNPVFTASSSQLPARNAGQHSASCRNPEVDVSNDDGLKQ